MNGLPTSMHSYGWRYPKLDDGNLVTKPNRTTQDIMRICMHSPDEFYSSCNMLSSAVRHMYRTADTYLTIAN